MRNYRPLFPVRAARYNSVRNKKPEFLNAIGKEREMELFENLKSVDPVEMMSEEYLPAIEELQRAD
ncbi:MAG: hypothetical protein IJM13_00705, partial [Lachnospiraceae bacterium]|nr:hypothetical protein [Lachnospiraceae bacterium]